MPGRPLLAQPATRDREADHVTIRQLEVHDPLTVPTIVDDDRRMQVKPRLSTPEGAGQGVVYDQGVGPNRPAASVSGLSGKALVAVVRTAHHNHSVASHLEADGPGSPPQAKIGPHFGRVRAIDHDRVVRGGAPLP